MMKDIFNKLLILRSPKIGPAKYNALMRQFNSVDEVVRSMNIEQGLRDSVSREIDYANANNISYLCDDDDRFPVGLRAVKNHPPVISVRGNIAALQKPVVSIVGTRHATAAGMEFVAKIAEEFSKHNYAVASGMAMGIDTAAHKGALRGQGNAQTIAVLAGGVDYIWPLENESLYAEIIERGAVISEMPVGFMPLANNFVQRNKLVAGLAEKLILAEADIKSGSMTTVRFALDLNRELWAVPSHPSDLRAKGPNSLIAAGDARLCQGKEDFFQIDKTEVKKSENEKKIENNCLLFDAIGTIPVSESVLTDVVKKSISEIKRELVLLELQGLIRKCDGGYVRV